MEIKLKSKNKINVTSLEINEGIKDAHLVVELRISTNWNTKRFEFKRFAYFDVEQEVEETHDVDGNKLPNPIVVIVKKQIPLHGNDQSKVRFFDEKDIEGLFQLFDKDIKVSDGYFKGNANIIKAAAKYQLDNEPDFKKIGVKEFDVV
jgi:hypothetical protein